MGLKLLERKTAYKSNFTMENAEEITFELISKKILKEKILKEQILNKEWQVSSALASLTISGVLT